MKRSALLLAALLLMVCAASAQNFEAAVNAYASFTNTSNQNLADRTATTSGGGFLTLGHSGVHNGFQINLGYTKNSQTFNSPSGPVVAPIATNVYQSTADWIVHREYKSIRPFAFVGGGVLSFSPTGAAIKATPIPISRQNRPTFLYGGGADLRLMKELALRAQFRGLIYQAPDYGNNSLHTGSAMLTFEPSLGLVFRF